MTYDCPSVCSNRGRLTKTDGLDGGGCHYPAESAAMALDPLDTSEWSCEGRLHAAQGSLPPDE